MVATCYISTQDLEIQLQTETESLHDQIASLEEQLGEEKQRREDAENENVKQKQVCHQRVLLEQSPGW